LEKLYRGKIALPPLNTATVQVRVLPAPEPVSKYDQGLVDSPQKGTETPITWRQINTFWSGEFDKRIPGSNAVLKIMRNGVYVHVKLKKQTKDFHKRNFELVRTQEAKQDFDDNAIPTLKQAGKVMALFSGRWSKRPRSILSEIGRSKMRLKGPSRGGTMTATKRLAPGSSQRPPGSSAPATNHRS
jgi:hypothetical protein